MNIYLIIIAILLIFIGINMSKISKFIPVNTPGGIQKDTSTVEASNSNNVPIHEEPNVYLLDTRIEYPTSPPVNPNVKKSILKKRIQASPDLYFNQTYDSKNALVDSPPVESTNELYYSGGTNQLIQIPLQYNDLHNQEQLRSQNILITPYNRIKYSMEASCQED